MWPERRQYPRSCTNQETVCAKVSGRLPNFKAYIVDISQGGVRLLVEQFLNVGDLLRIKLSRVVERRLIHATPTQDGKWIVGCAFDGAISESDVNALVRNEAGNVALDLEVVAGSDI
jgi:PilZ domain